MTTRGIFALVLLTTACSSTTATYADRDQEDVMGGASSIASTSPGATKSLGAVSTTTASGGASAASSSEPEPVAASGGAATFSTNVALHDLVGGQSSAGGATSEASTAAGGAQPRFSFPEQLPASGGTEAAGGSSARMVAVPAGAAGIGAIAGATAVAGAAGTVERPQLTADPKSLDQYWTANKGPYCSTLYVHPSDMCEPVDPTAAPATWTWRAKRGTGNIALDACLPQADEVCGGYSAASICGAEYVLEDGTCGPTAQYEKACAAVDAKYRCFVACLACVQKDDPDLYKFRSRCESALQGVQSGGITCPTY